MCRFLLAVKKAGNDFCELPLKAPEEVKKEIQEVTVSPATAKEISIDAVVEAVQRAKI